MISSYSIQTSISIHKKSIISFLLTFITIAIYWQVIGFDFVSFDDYMYVRDNPNIRQGLSLKTVQWAFTSVYAANWHPITWLSHMIDVELFGLKPGMHHVTNVIFHIANTLLLFYFLMRMTDAVWKSAIVATLFALHPIHVESIAWVSERKDVLSTFFWMLTMISYSWYVEHRTSRRYIIVASCYVFGLMSKPMLVTLPFVLLLLDFWPLKRPELIRTEEQNDSTVIYFWSSGIRWSGMLPLMLEKVPLFLLSGAASYLTVLAQKSGDSISTLDMIPLYIRLQNTIISYITYLEKTLLPFHLAVFYPYPKIFSPLFVSVSLLLLLLVTLLMFILSKRFPFLPVGWLWYLGTLVPVIGIVQVGKQSMADRYTYIPLIGIFIILTWGLPALMGHWRPRRYILIGIICMIVPGLLWATWLHIGYWKNNVTLFSHAIEVTKDNYLAHDSLGAALFNLGKLDAAIYHYSEALKIKPKYMRAHNNLGVALAKQGKYSEAIYHYRESLQIDPNYAGAHYNLGIALAGIGKVDEAIKEYKTAIQLEPQHANAHNNLGYSLAERGKVDEAITQYKVALSINPDFIKARLNLVSILTKCGKFDDAILQVNEGLLLEPHNSILRYQLAGLFVKKGDENKAIAEYENLLSIQSNYTPALNSLAILYVNEKKYNMALSVLKNMLKQKPEHPEVYYNIACVYAKQNMINESIDYLNQAIKKGFHNYDLIKNDTDLTNIRTTPFYNELIKTH